MSALLTSIPGDIPGLLRRTSPVVSTIWAHGPAIVRSVSDDGVVTDAWGDPCPLADHALDLTDSTGRWRAACWVQAQRVAHYNGVGPDWLSTVPGWYTTLTGALHDMPMTPERIDTLARLVLRLAGRAA